MSRWGSFCDQVEHSSNWLENCGNRDVSIIMVGPARNGVQGVAVKVEGPPAAVYPDFQLNGAQMQINLVALGQIQKYFENTFPDALWYRDGWNVRITHEHGRWFVNVRVKVVRIME